jgi:hypothetical protein
MVEEAVAPNIRGHVTLSVVLLPVSPELEEASDGVAYLR